jgi:hypothetical protein
MFQRFARKGSIGISVVCLGILSGCGGSDEVTAVKVKAPVETPVKSKAPPANNPLAKQQSTLKDAAAVQGLLNKNSDAKKKALEESMN